MDNVPYDDWTEYLCGLLAEYGVSAVPYERISDRPDNAPGEKDHPIVAELGCGTGSITRRLRDRGFEMIGIDMSEDMLRIAREKEADGDESILYLEQDMREFELYGSVAAVISLCDSINYLESDDDLFRVFSLVHNYLDDGGVFIFDLNTEYYYNHILGEQTIAENRPEGSFIWDNYYDPDTRTNEFDLTIYYQTRSTHDATQSHAATADDADAPKCFERFTETHFQHAFRVSDVKRLLAKSGLKLQAIYPVLTHDAPARDTERLYFIAVK